MGAYKKEIEMLQQELTEGRISIEEYNARLRDIEREASHEKD